MASPAQLMRTISGATGVPLPTVVDIDRRLLKGNLRTKGGRGISVAQMTPIDAARLLTAILASPQANTSVDAVKRYSETQIDKTRSSEKLFAAANLDELMALVDRHSFVAALAALITSASTGSLGKQIAQSKDKWIPHIEVFAFTRATYGRIRLTGLPNGLTASVEYLPVGTKSVRAKTARRSHMATGNECIGDLEQSRRITERTILSIAELLAQEVEHV